jgi:SAM-dependent methyltransferase
VWQVQLATGLVKAALPFRDDFRRMVRKVRPYRANRGNTYQALEQGLRQVRLLRDAGANLSGTVLELGSGWLPVVPLLFYLAGAERLLLTDIQRLMDERTVEEAKRTLRESATKVADKLGLAEGEVRARLDRPFPHDYFVPWNPRDLADGSVDVVISRTVLEHIPPDVLEGYMPEFARILRPGGMMCHVIDNSDHWEHHDKSISRLHFLRYEEGLLWRTLCVRRYQNRLRHSDYMNLFERHGFVPLFVEAEPDARSMDAVKSLPLASPFRGRDAADLAILTSTVVLRRPALNGGSVASR